MKTTTWKTIIGISLMPLVFSVFLIDRVILTFLFWKEIPSMKTWMLKDKLMMKAFWRIVFTAIIYGFIKLFQFIF